MAGQDHHARFRAVGICGTTGLLAAESEAPATSVFLMGYSVGPLTGVLENLLTACGIPKPMVPGLSKKIVSLAGKHGLDASGFGGAACKSGRSGHMLQIFMRRELVDKYAYGSHAMGVPDKARPVLSKALGAKGPICGQVRIACDPLVFMRANCVRMFVYSADPTFHKNREAFQEELTDLLHPILGAASTRKAAAKGIFAGKLPDWWSPPDQSDAAKVANPFK
eukprot:NODE_304_length_1001_cov_329.391800_g301_i0.p1 GENE.NODE_304_length_1001_cov_329.391800_g301_i0~~NODE_304_length_1001_cov_329.391800_g301_i0.p1  ORF type:complete len:223 (-),score=33.56 NODE_304_length_1001_cov_329.391800_g301_i0:108-776(-)